MNAVQAADPDSGLLFCFLLFLGKFHLVFRVLAPCVVGFVIDDQNVGGIGHFTQNFAGIGFVALCTALINTAPLGNGFLTVPCQCLPVGDHDLTLMQLVHQSDRNDVELDIVIIIAACLQNL